MVLASAHEVETLERHRGVRGGAGAGHAAKRVPADALQERKLWRDRRLMALAAHKRRALREIGP